MLKDHHKSPTVSQDCPIGKLEQHGGYVLTVSCEDAVTLMHVVEHTNHVQCLGIRTEEYTGSLADGRQVKLRTWGWRKGPCDALDTPKIFGTMRQDGELSEITLGQARPCLIRCSVCRKACEPLLAAHCPQCLVRAGEVEATVPTDCDTERDCLLPIGTAFTGEPPTE